jgi:hypothetical protein
MLQSQKGNRHTIWSAFCCNSRGMKKIIIVFGAVLLAIIVLLLAVIGITAISGSTLDKESKAYVDENLPLIISAWDEQELLNRASPEFMQNTKMKALDKDFAFLSRKFGNMQSYQGSEGQSYVNYSIMPSNIGRVTTAVYAAKVTFANGPAAIRLGLIKHGDAWQITGFKITTVDTSIPAKDAINHVGEDAVVRGVISEIYISRQNTNVYLYLDGDIKNAKCAVVWLGTNHPPVKGLEKLIESAGTISVSGKITTEKQVPEIFVNSWAQINR